MAGLKIKNLLSYIIVAAVSSTITFGLFWSFIARPSLPEEVETPVYKVSGETPNTTTTSNTPIVSVMPSIDFSHSTEEISNAVVLITDKQHLLSNWTKSSINQTYGSGVLLSSNGYLVTNSHVVEDNDHMTVTLCNNRTYEAKVICNDIKTDLAILKIEAIGLPFLTFGNSDSLVVGDWILAAGHPFKRKTSITAGIVSAKNVTLDVYDDTEALSSFIQTDAVINNGSSGGPLVNKKGEIVGINAAIVSRSGRYEGYSFAIPANIVKKVYRDVIKYGTVKHVQLGWRLQETFLSQSDRNPQNDISGVKIVGFDRGQHPTLKIGDIILGINGSPTRNITELKSKIHSIHSDESMSMSVWRDEKEFIQNIVVLNTIEDIELVKRFGVAFREISNDMGLKQIVLYQRSISRGIPKNLKEGFILEKVNGKKVANLSDLDKWSRRNSHRLQISGRYPSINGTFNYEIKAK